MSRKPGIFISCLVLAFAVSQPVHAINGGVLGGISVNWLGGDSWHDALDEFNADNHGQPELVYGAFLEFSYSDRVSFRPEIQVIAAMGEGTGTLAGLPSRIEATARVLHVPLFVCGRYPSGPGNFYGLLGPTFNFFLTDIRNESTLMGMDTKASENPYYGVVIGAAAGIGYELPILSARVTADLRYHRSLTPIMEEGEDNFQSAVFMLGVSLPIPTD